MNKEFETFFSRYSPFRRSEADIINNKKTGVIYVADFTEKTGKYISIVEHSLGVQDNHPDIEIKVSPKIQLRITYILDSKGGSIRGVEVAKVFGEKIDKINLSNFDFDCILQFLYIFTEMDLNIISNGSVLLDESIIGDTKELKKFLDLVSKDPLGKEKLSEVAKNLGLVDVGDIDLVVQKKNAINKFESILNNTDGEFEKEKQLLGVGKDEEVWQKFFESNSWILGADFVQVLEERVLDENSTVDIPVKDFDGFINIIELKLPSVRLWNSDLSPTSDLTKAIMQCARYVTEAERRMNDKKKTDSLGADILKPRLTLICGRSSEWTSDVRERFKILNSCFHDIAILTYDHVLARAKGQINLK